MKPDFGVEFDIQPHARIRHGSGLFDSGTDRGMCQAEVTSSQGCLQRSPNNAAYLQTIFSGGARAVFQRHPAHVRVELSPPQAQSILEEVGTATKRWKDVATSAAVGLQTHELNDFKAAFES